MRVSGLSLGPGAAKGGRRGIELRGALCMFITGASRTTGDMASSAGICWRARCAVAE